jgi:AraC-like DNA-binding protein/mannose-6-phosphate isomerase-like protein (cupin superfamily)
MENKGDFMEDKKSALKIKKGYLNDDFKLFHIRDSKSLDFQFHYHDFYKIIIFISGKVNYLIEGRTYKLKPWDILLVSSSETHKAVIDSSEVYERIVIWVNSNFLEKYSSQEGNLLTSFEIASRDKFNLLRASAEVIRDIKHTVNNLEKAGNDRDFGSKLLKNSLFLQLMVFINRVYLRTENNKSIIDIEYDETIEKILDYIKDKLTEDLSIEKLAALFFINKYYLMHKFKEQTGYTIHNYILQKRLIYANSLMKSGRSVTEACMACGFNDYSSFLKAFKNMFGLSPKKYYKTLKELRIEGL